MFVARDELVITAFAQGLVPGILEWRWRHSYWIRINDHLGHLENGSESTAQAKSIFETISQEMAVNQINIESNLSTLTHELSILNHGQSVVNALRPIKTGFWEIAKSNNPSKIFPPQRLAELRYLGVLADEVHQQIRSRENYRLHNGAMNNFSGRIRLYDDILVAALREFEEAISAYQREGKVQDVTSSS